jgi:hypothetical protein
MKRNSLTKTIRFEVFKRDKFTCHYCGRKAPDVVLHVDHIEPVSKGGTDDIVNLITSCFDCNLGKSNKKLSDNTVIEKQRKQLELLQERREQIELMFQWKKSLSKLDDETVEMLKDYADAKIQPFSINDNGKTIISTLLRKYGVNEVLDAIDVSATTYLKFSKDGELEQGSAEKFLDKIGGILFNRRLKPIDQKLAFIKNKARNGFNYYDSRVGAILLNKYVAALRKSWHYSDEEILNDLDCELIPKLEETTNWTGWRGLLEGWIESVTKQEKNESPEASKDLPKDRTHEELVGLFQGRKNAIEEAILVLNHLLAPYPNFNKENFKKILHESLIKFVKKQEELSDDEMQKYDKDEIELQCFITDFSYDKTIRDFLNYDFEKEPADRLSLLVGLDSIIYDVIEKLFTEQFYFSPNVFSSKDLPVIRRMTVECLEDWANDISSQKNQTVKNASL